MPRRGKRNPLLAAAIAGSTISGVLARREARLERKERKREESKALVPYRGSSAMTVNRPPRRPIGQTSSLSSANAVLAVAPVAGGIVSSGTRWTFDRAKPLPGLQGIRVCGRQIWAKIATVAGSGAQADTTAIQVFSSTTTSQNVLTFDPDDTATCPPPITSFALCFGRYALRRARLIYTPSFSTNSNFSVALAVLTDAGNAQALQHLSPSTSTTAFQVSEYSNSVMGPVWQSMVLDVPCDQMLRYTYQSASDASLSVAEERQDHAFAVIAALNTTISNPSTWGYLHIDYEIDFYEVVPQVNEVSILRMQRRLDRLKEVTAAPKRACDCSTSDSQHAADCAGYQRVSVERKGESPARDEEKAPISSSLEVAPQGRLSGGWSVVPSVFQGVRYVSQDSGDPTPRKAQSLKS